MPDVSSQNASPVINIVAWFLLTTSILSVLTRVARKYAVVRRLMADDYLIVAALAFAILNCICLSIATANGYGKSAMTLSEGGVQAALKAQYAADLMYIPSLCLSKVSVMVFVKSIIGGFSTKKSVWIVIAGIALWGVTAEIVAAVQCHVPRPWDYVDGKCFQMTAWWNYFAASNIAIEVVLVVLPGIIFSRLQTTVATRTIVMAYFSVRILVIVAVVCELVYRNRIDRPHSMLKTWPVAICKEVVQCTSIVSASAPQFKGFMESLESSGLRLYELPTPKSSRRTASASYQQRSSWSRRTRPTLRRLTPPSREYLEIDSISGRNTAADFEATVTAATRNSNGSLDSRPREPGVIHETITWAVTKEGSQADINR